MSRGKRILELMQELAEMPEYQLVMQLQGLSISIYTFDRNYADLCNLITFLASDPRADSLFGLRNRDQLMLVMKDIIRLLHNYVASALSLIDHTRRLHKKLYADSGDFPDYQSRINRDFAQDPLSQFVRDLRRYCQHYRAPNLDVTESWNRGDERVSRTVNLLVEDLRMFEDWSATATRYLDTAGEKVDVLEVATHYRNKVIAFYEWFQSRQGEIHAEEIQRFREKERELLLLMLEDEIDICFAKSRQGIPYRKEEIFLSIFTSKEFEEIDSIPPDSNRRSARAIELLEERYFPVPEEIKQKIHRLYQQPDVSPQEESRSEPNAA